MNYLKKILSLLSVILLTLSSCDKAFENGELDGMWRLERIAGNGDELFPQDIYYSFQRHIVMFGKYYDEGMPHLYMGTFARSGSLLKMEQFKEYPGIEDICEAHVLESFGIYSTDAITFVVVSLDDENLVMNSDGREYYFRKW